MSTQTTDEYGNVNWLDEQGLYHRLDGPALITPLGSRHWFHHGSLHRAAGPAVELRGGERWWYLHDVKYTEAEYALLSFIHV
jgi:hypothetical protein